MSTASIQFDLQRPTEISQKTETRISALDWTKGILIICMVAYHAINYSAFRPWAFKFLGFLPPSFILISGFIVAQVYVGKYGSTPAQLCARLITRGLRLLLLCSALNLAHFVALEKDLLEGVAEFGFRAKELFLTGNSKVGIFEILLPIGYLLLIAPALVLINARHWAFSPLIAISVFAVCVYIEHSGWSYKNLNLLSVGVFGFALGTIPLSQIDTLARQWVPGIACYAAYHFLNILIGDRYAIHTLGVIASIFLIYSAALASSPATTLSRAIIGFGNYSLAAYIAQIGVLRLLVKVANGFPQTITGVIILTIATLVLTAAIVFGIHLCRRIRVFNKTYKVIFG